MLETKQWHHNPAPILTTALPEKGCDWTASLISENFEKVCGQERLEIRLDCLSSGSMFIPLPAKKFVCFGENRNRQTSLKKVRGEKIRVSD